MPLSCVPSVGPQCEGLPQLWPWSLLQPPAPAFAPPGRGADPRTHLRTGPSGHRSPPASVGGRLQRCARPTLQVDAKSEESEGPAPSLAGTHGQPPPAPSAQRPAPLRPEAPPPFSHSAAGLGAHPTWWTCCSFWDCWPGLGGGRPPEAGAGEPADDGDAFSRPRRTERSLRPETGTRRDSRAPRGTPTSSPQGSHLARVQSRLWPGQRKARKVGGPRPGVGVGVLPPPNASLLLSKQREKQTMRSKGHGSPT